MHEECCIFNVEVSVDYLIGEITAIINFVFVSERWKPSKVSTNDIFRAMQLSLQAAMVEPMTQVKTIITLHAPKTSAMCMTML